MLIGNLGNSPDPIKGGCKLNVAPTHVKKGGEKTTVWFNVAVFGDMAENCVNFLEKGSKVFIEGHVESNEFTDKHGHKQVGFNPVADRVRFL